MMTLAYTRMKSFNHAAYVDLLYACSQTKWGHLSNHKVENHMQHTHTHIHTFIHEKVYVKSIRAASFQILSLPESMKIATKVVPIL